MNRLLSAATIAAVASMAGSLLTAASPSLDTCLTALVGSASFSRTLWHREGLAARRR